MTRRVGGAVILGLLALAVSSLASASQHDLTVDQFFLPGTNTSGYRVHTSTTRAHMNVTIPRGNIWAVGGYKTLIPFTHVATASLTSVAIGLHQSGVSYQRLGYEGSVLGISLASSEALTAGTATATATIRRRGIIESAGVSTSIGVGNPAQFSSAAQARGRAVFLADQEIGCRLTTSADIAPPAQLLCTVIVDF